MSRDYIYSTHKYRNSPEYQQFVKCIESGNDKCTIPYNITLESGRYRTFRSTEWKTVKRTYATPCGEYYDQFLNGNIKPPGEFDFKCGWTKAIYNRK